MALPTNSYRRGGDRYFAEMTDGDEERMMEEVADEIESDPKVPLSIDVRADVDDVSPFVTVEGVEFTDDDKVLLESIAREWNCRVEYPSDGTAEVRPK